MNSDSLSFWVFSVAAAALTASELYFLLKVCCGNALIRETTGLRVSGTWDGLTMELPLSRISEY
jgi:hypothetical protein